MAYDAIPGSVSCCSTGFYWDAMKRICHSCPGGETTRSTRDSRCIKCPPGSFREYMSYSECIPCAPGDLVLTASFSDAALAAFAEIAFSAAGQYQSDTSQTRCNQCSPGFYAPARESTICQVFLSTRCFLKKETANTTSPVFGFSF